MKSYKQVQKQLNGLVNGIRECGFIPYEDKKDIVQDSMVRIIEKMNEGVLKDDATEIRGYVFQILRNNCLAYHRLSTRIPTVTIEWDLIDEPSLYLELLDEKKKIIESKIQAVKYNNTHREYIRLVLENKTKEEIMEELNLDETEVRRMRQGLVLRLKSDLTRPVKYVIRNKNKSAIQVPCFTRGDVKYYLRNIPSRRISYMIDEGYVTDDGFYVETLHKIIRKKKGSSK